MPECSSVNGHGLPCESESESESQSESEVNSFFRKDAVMSVSPHASHPLTLLGALELSD